MWIDDCEYNLYISAIFASLLSAVHKGSSLAVQWLPLFLLQRAWVWSLVREQRSHRPTSAVKNKKYNMQEFGDIGFLYISLFRCQARISFLRKITSYQQVPILLASELNHLPYLSANVGQLLVSIISIHDLWQKVHWNWILTYYCCLCCRYFHWIFLVSHLISSSR